MFAKAQRVHFIGIGGIGMSGIAEILLNLGYPVSGSDLRRTPITERLAALGATIFEGHAAANVVGSTVIVTSSAVNERNPEVIEARARKIPVIARAEMLAELMRLKYGIAVAGMHGKTTTTSMIATVLAAGELDPTVVVGGRVDALGSNARLGKSQYLVAEADESDRSFLKLSPILAVVTNLDREHMDCYRDMADVESAFVEFMDKVPFYGACVACLDNPLLASVLPRVRRRVFTYGTSARADFVVRMLAATEGVCSRFEVATTGGVLGPFELHVPGQHNVLNATAAIAIATQLEVAPEAIAQGLANFRGVDRRFQVKGCVHDIAVVDDYGHHPTEIRATLRAARDCGYRHVHVIFQPHRYTRTRDLLDEFVASFDDATTVEMLDIYAASEEPIPGVTAASLVKAIGREGVEYAGSAQEAVERVVARAQAGDVILTLGAGNVSAIAPQVLERLKEKA
ncbi:UDP-N-acetylmuramate--L-alanine ligase [Silvibacterium dinghuense]|uniref:UDP-N-acetylmuramate--L-alanine ligase n=1 Tax=Silvibacterium dinghuense TaxID=1560006 RepID=A0A4Q1SI35_9BACT|nr:UDP-N-acetylmuramate--L-alanine ligase [Silvibacterium dinghuense]RXS97268.1 UDP-N-acetylmuramate--L-alanine ligase [Silvibacterium dinghuense]GGG97657.1 UDP-N-acetylmuramate--L-alanine ligase [Silvibacterium dinghuense]